MTRPHGYTMVELVTVMVVIGVLAAVALPRLTGKEFSGPAFRAEVVSALRYAQKTSVSHRRLVCAALSANAVSLSIASGGNASACDTALALPDGSASYTSTDTSVVLGAAFSTLYFRPSGTITSDGAGNNTVATSVTVTNQTAIAIQGATGYVQ